MLPARLAVRLGLRAATRNPELSFGKALLDALGTVLSLLPWLLAVALLAASVGRFAMLALLASVAILFGVLLDVLAALILVRAAAFADTASKAFASAASLLGRRLGACIAMELAFALLQLIVASAAALFSGIVAGGLEPAVQILSVPLRLSVGLAFTAVFAWITVARHGAFAALAADAEGLIELPPEPPSATPV